MLITTDIAGVYIESLPVHNTQGGSVLPVYKPGSPMHSYLESLGKHCVEVYFSEINAHAVKAWKRHTLQQELFSVPTGMIRLVLYDSRQDSPTQGKLAVFLLGRPEHHILITVPPMIWYGFASVGETNALLCNCIDRPHDPKECNTLPSDTDLIPYSFSADTHSPD